MGIMATHTGQRPARPPPFLGSGDRMASNRMTPSDPGQPCMTADTEFVDRFIEHELLIGGVGIMAGHATLSFDYAVDKRQRFFLAHQVFLVAVAGYAKCRRAFGPKLVAVFPSMRVMAEGATSEVQRSVDEFAGKPGFFTGMAGEADVLALGSGEPDSPWPDGLLVTGEALLVGCRSVLPWALGDNVLMTDGAGGLFLQAHRFDGCGPLQIMATVAALGKLVVLMKERDFLAKRIQVHVGLKFTITKFDLLVGR